MLKRVVVFVSLWLVAAGWFSVTAAAETEKGQTYETMPPAWGEVEEYLPEDIRPLLPEGMFSSDPEEALTAVQEASTLSYMLTAVMDALGLRLGDAVALLCTLMGLLLMAAVMRGMRDSLTGKGAEAFGFCLRLVMYAAIVAQAVGMVSSVTVYFEQLRGLTAGMMPVMGVLYAMGGNVSTAALNHELLLVFLTVCQYVSTVVTPPFCGVCMAFSLLDAFESRVKLSPLAVLIKRWYVTLLGFVMFLLGTVLALQSVLASRADTLGIRGIKYAVGQMIPVVGGAVSGTLGTVATVMDMLRGVCGTCGVVLLMLLLLPTLLQILLFRWMFTLSSTVAAMLGCEGESKLMEEMGSLYGYLAAAVGICALFFVVAMGIFIGGKTAMG